MSVTFPWLRGFWNPMPSLAEHNSAVRRQRYWQMLAARRGGRTDPAIPAKISASENPTLPAGPQNWQECSDTANGSLTTIGYLTLIDLRQALLSLPNPGATTAIVVLDEHFKGHVPTLIERPDRAYRLILVSLSGCWSTPVGDIVLHSRLLGWQGIACERDLAAALEGATSSRQKGERTVLFFPAWRTRST